MKIKIGLVTVEGDETSTVPITPLYTGEKGDIALLKYRLNFKGARGADGNIICLDECLWSDFLHNIYTKFPNNIVEVS